MHNFERLVRESSKEGIEGLYDITKFVNRFFGGDKVIGIRVGLETSGFGTSPKTLRIELDVDTLTRSYMDVIHSILYCIEEYLLIDFHMIKVLFG